jgi:hemolysin III
MLERRQSINEEIANSLTHGLFLLAAVICSPILIAKSIQTKDNISIITTSVFAAVVILVYFISTLYHAMPRNRAKDKLRLIDYGAIFLLIAGTYTPFALNVIKGKWGWALFSIDLSDYGLASAYRNRTFLVKLARLGTFLDICGRRGLYPWDILL